MAAVELSGDHELAGNRLGELRSGHLRVSLLHVQLEASMKEQMLLLAGLCSGCSDSMMLPGGILASDSH